MFQASTLVAFCECKKTKKLCSFVCQRCTKTCIFIQFFCCKDMKTLRMITQTCQYVKSKQNACFVVLFSVWSVLSWTSVKNKSRLLLQRRLHYRNNTYKIQTSFDFIGQSLCAATFLLVITQYPDTLSICELPSIYSLGDLYRWDSALNL